jgi:putative aldouronate transport system permease protein
MTEVRRDLKIPPVFLKYVQIHFNRCKMRFKNNLSLHLMILPSLLAVLIFSYLPMGGLIIAFQKFIPAKGLFGDQKFIGLDNFRYVLSLPTFWQVMANTVIIAVAKIILITVIPIIFSILLNEVRSKKLKKVFQTSIYFPYFISWVILGGIMIDILAPSDGIVNGILGIFGMKPIFFLGDVEWFRGTIVLSDIWKNFGFGTVVYLAAIMGIDPCLYESAQIDGAGKLRQIWHVTLPGMSMTIILLAVLGLGNILNAGFEQIFNLYSPMVYPVGDILDTLVYRLGLLQAQFGPATAVGLAKSVISFVLISFAYYFAYKKYDYRIF